MSKFSKIMFKFSQIHFWNHKSRAENLDARLLWFLRQRCAYFAIFETQLRINGEFDHQKDSAIFGIHNTSQIKVRIFSLPRSPIFNLRWFECLKIPVTMFTEEWLNFFSLLHPPIFTSDDLNVWNFSNNATMVLNWLVWNLYPLYFFSWWNPMYINVQLQKFTNSVQNCTLV